jgi:hypothetical protein
MSCPGLHCDGCGKGSIGVGGAAVIAGTIFYLANRQQVNHDVDDVIHVILITVLVLMIAGAITAATFIYIKVRAWQRRREAATAPMIILPPATAHTIPATSASAVGSTPRAAIAAAAQPAYPHLTGHASAPRRVRCPAPSRLHSR